MFHVSLLQFYIKDESYVIFFDSIELSQNLTFDEEPMAILDR